MYLISSFQALATCLGDDGTTPRTMWEGNQAEFKESIVYRSDRLPTDHRCGFSLTYQSRLARRCHIPEHFQGPPREFEGSRYPVVQFQMVTDFLNDLRPLILVNFLKDSADYPTWVVGEGVVKLIKKGIYLCVDRVT